MFTGEGRGRAAGGGAQALDLLCVAFLLVLWITPTAAFCQEPHPAPKVEVLRGVQERLAHKSPGQRRAAATFCGTWKVRGCLPRLTVMIINDPEPGVRSEVAWALGRIKDDRTTPHLEAAALQDKDKAVCEAAAKALKRWDITARPGPYWEWEEYKAARNGRNMGIVILAGGGFAGIATMLVGVVGRFFCILGGATEMEAPSCQPYDNAIVAGGVVLGIGVAIGLPVMITYWSKLDRVTPEWLKPLPILSLAAGKTGAQFGLTWRF